jgi:hypothetical protein
MPKDDDISAIPSISAKRDNAPASAAVPRPRGGSRSSNRGDKGGSGGGGRPGLLSGFMLLLALVIGLSACVWAWQLQEKLTVAGTHA